MKLIVAGILSACALGISAAGLSPERIGLIGLQNGPCDLACVYDARCGIGNYSPLFDPMTYKPHKAYYAFTAFNELRRRETAVKATSSDERVFVTAAKGVSDAAVMIVNESNDEKPLTVDFQGRRTALVRITDAERTDASVSLPERIPPHSILIIVLK